MSDILSWIPDPSTMRLIQTDDGIHVTFDRPANGRRCGDCQACCKLLPTPEMGKPANTRCQHQRAGKGCVIYERRPESCRVFVCRWLADPETAGLKRPDRSHYVLDAMPDTVQLQDDATGALTTVPVIQIWVDPQYPHAHRDPALRAYLSRMAESFGIAGLVRWDSSRALALFAPCFDRGGEWHEVMSVLPPGLPTSV